MSHVEHNNKAITNPLALSLLTGLNQNNNKKRISDSDFVRSPKSPLDLKVLCTMAEPFLSFRSSSLTAHLNCCCGLDKVGLSIVDSLGNDRVLSPDVVFGPALRIKSSEIKVQHEKPLKIDKERSGVVFEIGGNEAFGSRNSSFSANRVLSRSKLVGAEGDNVVSEDEMEMSEEYTCVIAHGPNPKTTHIYGDRALECNKNEFIKRDHNESDDFLSLCNFCNKKLEASEDIYMYREKAFCSEECRLDEMMMIDEEDSEDPCMVMHESLKKLI